MLTPEDLTRAISLQNDPDGKVFDITPPLVVVNTDEFNSLLIISLLRVRPGTTTLSMRKAYVKDGQLRYTREGFVVAARMIDGIIDRLRALRESFINEREGNKRSRNARIARLAANRLTPTPAADTNGDDEI